MAGEYFDLDEIVRFGWPWHGLCRNGTTALPGGNSRASAITPQGGECFALRVPGLAAVATSAEDTAGGMTWLNYALISGRNHVFYGQELGRNQWVYLDADNQPWRVYYTILGDTLGMTARRFADGLTQTCSVTLPFSMSGNPLRITDINSTGRRVLLCVIENGTQEINPRSAGLKHAELAVEFSTVGASATLAELAFSTVTVGGSDASIEYERVLHRYNTETSAWEVGATQTSTTSAWLYVWTSENPWPVDPLPVPEGWSIWYYSKKRCTLTTTHSTGQGGVWCYGQDDSLLQVRQFEVYVYTGCGVEQNWSPAVTNPHEDPPTLSGSNHGSVARYAGLSLTGEPQNYLTHPLTNPTVEQWWFVRYGNRLFGLMRSDGSAVYQYAAPVSQGGQHAGEVIEASYAAIPSAAYHPVTGEVVFEAAGSAICFV